jgi:hypothetical protein
MYGRRAQLHRFGREIHRPAQQKLKLGREVHVRENRRAMVEAKPHSLGATVAPAEQDLALESDALGFAGLPRDSGGVNYVLP